MTRGRTRLLCLFAASATLTATVSACSSSGVDARTAAVRDTNNVSLNAVCTDTSCSGKRSGAAFKIQLPPKDKWNGTLIIWSHAYRAAAAVPVNPLDPSVVTPIDHSAQDAPNSDVASSLVSDGYALAGSAFASNGWDVQDGVRADQDLYQYFSTTFGTPKRVYLWGESLGSLIAETLAETHPTWVSGVAPMCGLLAGTNQNFDLALDVAYAVKTLIYPKLQLTGFTSNDEAVQQWRNAATAVNAAGQKNDLADLFAIASIGGLPNRTDVYDGSTLQSQIHAIVQGIIDSLYWSTTARYELEQRVGGNPSQNTNVDYSKRITPSPLIGAKLGGIEAALAKGTRVSADATARSRANALGDPTGAIQRQTITLHNEADPSIIVQNENAFGVKVNANADTGQLVQLYTGPPTKYSNAPYGAGTCNFTNLELVGLVQILDNWVRYDVYAGPGGVAQVLNYTVNNAATNKNTPKTIAAGTATTGYDPNFAAPPWPAASTG